MNQISSIATNRPADSHPQPRLIQAAQEFEAQLMKELLKPMTAVPSLYSDESDEGRGTILGDFATESLGQALSRQGGLGIATSILHTLSRSGNVSSDPSRAGHEANIFSQGMATHLK